MHSRCVRNQKNQAKEARTVQLLEVRFRIFLEKIKYLLKIDMRTSVFP